MIRNIFNKNLLRIIGGSIPVVLAGAAVYAGFKYVEHITAMEYVRYHYDGDLKRACEDLGVSYNGKYSLRLAQDINKARFK